MLENVPIDLENWFVAKLDFLLSFEVFLSNEI
jgi:hypothetical protein